MNKILLGLGCLLLVTGCASAPTIYTSDFTSVKQPQMSFPEAYQNVKQGLETMTFPIKNLEMTNEGFSFQMDETIQDSGQFDQAQKLTVTIVNGTFYYVLWNSNFDLVWKTQNEAQRFVDSVMAIKYYASKQYLTDEVVAFANFQEKAKVWQTLPQRSSLPEEVRRFRVLADDAVQDKDFNKAADYYEQGLAIDPMWPTGQYNAAIICGELKFYHAAVMHMKRYLALKPDAQDAKADQDKVYIWEDKANENK